MEEEAIGTPSCKTEDVGGGEVELEAAEALAALAHYSSSSSSSSSSRKRETGFAEDQSERPSEGFKNKSSTEHDSDKTKLVKKSSNAIVFMAKNPANSAQEIELKSSLMCNRGRSSVSGSKSQHNKLTEAEKEERRLRRVLANRESARQTIRRRQAMYEELTRKAADLATENENLKREKEQALRVYDSLSRINKRLKAREAEMAKAEAKENQGYLGLTCSQGSISNFGIPGLPCNQPSVMPSFWPSAFRPSDALHLPCSCRNCISIASIAPVPTIAKSDLVPERECPRMVFRTGGTPIYVLPFPWILPFHTQCSAHNLQSSDHNAPHDKTCLNLLCTASSSSKAKAHMEDHQAPLPAKINPEISCSTETISHPPHATKYSLAQDECRDNGTRRLVLNPAPLSCLGRLAIPEPSHKPEENVAADAATIPSVAGNSSGINAEKSEKRVLCPNRKSMNAIIAAEARRRRKELTKLKNLHCGNGRLH